MTDPKIVAQNGNALVIFDPTEVAKHYLSDGTPVSCWYCGSEAITENVIDVIDVFQGQGPTAEAEYVCSFCSLPLAWWSYGYFDPDFPRSAWERKLSDAS